MAQKLLCACKVVPKNVKSNKLHLESMGKIEIFIRVFLINRWVPSLPCAEASVRMAVLQAEQKHNVVPNLPS